jgi:hypothetical protein
MGFFSKIKKGFKKVVSKIGKGIRKVTRKVGKFMGKVGIVGQIGLALVLPGIGSMLGGFAGTLMGSSSAVFRGAGQILNAAVNVGTKATSMFKSVTEGVGKVLGDIVGATLNKIPGAGNLLKGVTSGRIDITSKTFADAWKTAQSAITDVATKGGDLFSMGTLTDPNKYITQAAASAGEAALAGTEGPSTWDDSKLSFLEKPPALSQDDIIDAGLDYTGPSVGKVTGVSTAQPSFMPDAVLQPDPAVSTQEVVKQRGAAIAQQGAEAAATATPPENLGMSEATFYQNAFETDPALTPTSIKGRGVRKQQSLLSAGKDIISALSPQEAPVVEESEGYLGQGIVGVYGTPVMSREAMPLYYQQFEADPTLAQTYAYGAGAAYSNYKKMFAAIGVA